MVNREEFLVLLVVIFSVIGAAVTALAVGFVIYRLIGVLVRYFCGGSR